MDPGRSRSRSVPDWVSQQYYRVGLMSASHPRPVLCLAVMVVIWSCWPLLSIPIYVGRPAAHVEVVNANFQFVPAPNSSEPLRPSWMTSEAGPVAYVQQIIMKAMVHPYRKDELIKTDAFRGPLASAFKLHLEDVASFRDLETGTDMDHVCLRTDGIADKYRSWAVTTNILPDYGCLILSPANLWQRDPRSFQMDPNVISTVFNFQKHQREGHSSLADIMFGLRQRDTGITKYPVRNRQRVITYAVTIAFANYNPTFVTAMKKHLLKLYPLIHDEIGSNAAAAQAQAEVVHLSFMTSKQTHVEWIPFLVTILMLFLYVYFSCMRIEFVKSKLGIAVSAIVTVICTTCMSLGLSGISLNMNSKISLVPYLVAFISLENILVVTQSVISTPAHLDVKIRIAQGLSKEGWNITKNLFAEITILTFIFLLGTIDASVQEFCHLAIMGLLADFFMQVTFFITILSLDISQMELSDSIRKPSKNVKMFQKPFHGPGHIKKTSNDQTSVVAPNCNAIPQVPAKRVRLINFFAKNRIIQRMFLLCMVGWISIFIYQSRFLDNLIKTGQHELFLPDNNGVKIVHDNHENGGPMMAALNDHFSSLSDFMKQPSEENNDKKMNSLKKLLPSQRPNQEVWSRLPSTHWPMLFSLYNISLQGHYITLLPPIHLSMIIGSESAKMLRHPKEAAAQKVTEAASAADDQEASEAESAYDEDAHDGPELSPYVPTSPSELFLAFVLCFPSLLFILYLVVILYRCVCSRNYAEWRSSWNGPEHKHFSDFYTQIIQESVPIELDGHKHEVECLACDGNIVISLCLGGTISTWDSYTGEIIAQMNRSRFFCGGANADHEESLPKVQEFTDFSRTINTNFSSLPKISSGGGSNGPFNFSKFHTLRNGEKKSKDGSIPISTSVWCMESEDGLIILGCASGRIEIWDAISGQLKGMHDDGKGVGVTHIKLSGLKLIVARLSGHIEFFEMKSMPSTNNQFHRANSTSLPTRRYHVRSGSNTSIGETEACFKFSPEDDIRLEWLFSARAHPQPLTCLDCQGGRILTGSHDHTLRVFRLDDYLAVYTLHGHCGPVTSAFIDKEDTSSACSGSQDGIMCTWDLLTGACVYSIQAHDGALLNLAYSSNYIISMGSDERLCVWERLQGHLINSIYLSGGPYCPDLVMLTHNLLITGRENNLVVWDVRLPDPVKIVKIGHPDSSQVVKIMCHLDDAIVCSYGSKLRLVRFPHFSGKSD